MQYEGTFWIRRFRDAWESCTHKKAVAFAIFTLVWNLSSIAARIWAGKITNFREKVSFPFTSIYVAAIFTDRVGYLYHILRGCGPFHNPA